MQTFLPYADFVASARALDGARLGKQRVEALQILRALHFDDYGWATHPAKTMWHGHAPALVVYAETMCREWTARGFADTVAAQVAEFAPEASGRSQAWLARRRLLPPWLGDAALHASHRAALARKDPAFYGSRFGSDPAVDYVWPAPPLPDHPVPEVEGVPAWVCRDAHAARAGVAAPEISRSLRGLDPAAARVALRDAGVRASPKLLRQLVALANSVEPGDLVVTPTDAGGLRVGRVRSGYRFHAAAMLPHAVAVTWADGELPRHAARPPYALQDPRRLFRVALDPGGMPTL